MAVTKALPRKSKGFTFASFLAIVGIVTVIISIWYFFQSPSKYGSGQLATNTSINMNTAFNANQLNVYGSPSLSAAQINAILAQHHSPAVETGQALYDASVATGINDAFPMGVFYAASQYGTLGAARANHSIGNLSNSSGVLVHYTTWAESYTAFLTLAKSAGEDNVQPTLDTLYGHAINPVSTSAHRNEPSVSLVLATMRELEK